MCEIQICAFAQDHIFSGENAEANRELLAEAIGRERVDVLGTTPYVEAGYGEVKRDIEWAIGTAMKSKKLLDFHLDYTLATEGEPNINVVLDELKTQKWA